MKKIFILALVSIFFLSCTPKSKQQPQSKIMIMTYNVENLFDTKDDPGKNDETYLPRSKKNNQKHRNKCGQIKNSRWRKSCLKLDWSETRLKEKMKRLAKVILSVNSGIGPDVVVLQEVENKNVLETLRKNFLKKANYHYSILIEGPDRRGIDVAMLSRLEVIGKPRLHDFYKSRQAKKRHPTRGLLEANFQLAGGQTLTVVGVHFPSQGAPSEARWQGVRRLTEIFARKSLNENIVVMGDFNITAKEERREKFFTRKLSKDWLVSHQVGCSNCKGTHSYKGKWSFLDVMLFSKKLQSQPWKLVPESIQVATSSAYQLTPRGEPVRFRSPHEPRGVSDHLPLVAELHYFPKTKK